MELEKAKDFLKELTMNDLMSNDANIDIGFHSCKNLKEAEEKLKPYKSLGFIRKHNRNDTHWLNIEFDDDQLRTISISAFYDVDGDNND